MTPKPFDPLAHALRAHDDKALYDAAINLMAVANDGDPLNPTVTAVWKQLSALANYELERRTAQATQSVDAFVHDAASQEWAERFLDRVGDDDEGAIVDEDDLR